MCQYTEYKHVYTLNRNYTAVSIISLPTITHLIKRWLSDKVKENYTTSLKVATLCYAAIIK